MARAGEFSAAGGSVEHERSAPLRSDQEVVGGSQGAGALHGDGGEANSCGSSGDSSSSLAVVQGYGAPSTAPRTGKRGRQSGVVPARRRWVSSSEGAGERVPRAVTLHVPAAAPPGAVPPPKGEAASPRREIRPPRARDAPTRNDEGAGVPGPAARGWPPSARSARARAGTSRRRPGPTWPGPSWASTPSSSDLARRPPRRQRRGRRPRRPAGSSAARGDHHHRHHQQQQQQRAPPAPRARGDQRADGRSVGRSHSLTARAAAAPAPDDETRRDEALQSCVCVASAIAIATVVGSSNSGRGQTLTGPRRRN